MVDLFLFLLALYFICVTAPIWVLTGLAWFCLLYIWAFIKFGFLLLINVVSLFLGFFSTKGQSFETFFSEVGLAIVGLLLSFWDAITSLFDPVSYMWDFARYEHALLAFFISIGLTIFWAIILSNSSDS